MNFSKNDTKVIKGIAVVLMLYHHLFTFAERMPQNINIISLFSIADNPISYWVGSFGKICVALFILLSGYGTYIAAKNTSLTENNFIFEKIKKLYIIYWKVFLIFIPICMFLNVDIVEKRISTFIWNFLGLNISYNGEWWFFTPFMILILLFPTIRKLISSENKLFEDIIVILLIDTFIRTIVPTFNDYQWANNLNNSLFWIKLNQSLDLLPGFLVGCFCAKYNLFSKLKEKFKSNSTNSICSLFIILLIFYMRIKTGAIYDFVYAPLFTISCIIFLNNKFMKYFYSLFLKIGNESTVIWLTHSFYCYKIIPQIIYYPRFAILIAAWLCFICYMTSKGINLIYITLSRFISNLRRIFNIS